MTFLSRRKLYIHLRPLIKPTFRSARSRTDSRSFAGDLRRLGTEIAGRRRRGVRQHEKLLRTQDPQTLPVLSDRSRGERLDNVVARIYR